MATISETIYSDAISWMKNFLFWFTFHWNLLLRIQWQYRSIGLDNGLAPNSQQAINLTNADPIHWRIYAALEADDLKR